MRATWAMTPIEMREQILMLRAQNTALRIALSRIKNGDVGKRRPVEDMKAIADKALRAQ